MDIRGAPLSKNVEDRRGLPPNILDLIDTWFRGAPWPNVGKYDGQVAAPKTDRWDRPAPPASIDDLIPDDPNPPLLEKNKMLPQSPIPQGFVPSAQNMDIASLGSLLVTNPDKAAMYLASKGIGPHEAMQSIQLASAAGPTGVNPNFLGSNIDSLDSALKVNSDQGTQPPNNQPQVPEAPPPPAMPPQPPTAPGYLDPNRGATGGFGARPDLNGPPVVIPPHNSYGGVPQPQTTVPTQPQTPPSGFIGANPGQLLGPGTTGPQGAVAAPGPTDPPFAWEGPIQPTEPLPAWEGPLQSQAGTVPGTGAKPSSMKEMLRGVEAPASPEFQHISSPSAPQVQSPAGGQVAALLAAMMQAPQMKSLLPIMTLGQALKV